MKNFLRVTVLAICAIFMVANVSAQDNYNATTMGEKVYLETASWGQNSPFNKQIFTSYGGSTNAKAGCVPTAYAIVMRYHGFPTEGTTKTLYNCQAPTYVEITDRVYDFSKMPLTYNSNWTQEQIDEVSKFFSHVLHACFPSSIGTGATTVNEGSDSKVLNDYFNYQLINASYQANFTMEQWIEKIKESIDNGCPIPYASDNSGTGDTRHMFVLDGYTANNYFHFNFGWNGSGNGWFKLDAITPSQGDNYSWIDGAEHYALFNLAPNKTMRTVTASVSPAGAGTVTVNGSANSAEVMEGITATLVATANSGYTFSHWSKDGTEVGTDMTYRAKVAAEGNEYVANFYTIGSSINIPVNYDSNMGSVTYNGNIVSATGFNPNEYSEVTLTAEANDGYMFTGWEIVEGTESTESNDNTVTFIAKNGITVNANFALAGGEYKINKDNITPSGGNNSYCSTWTYSKDGDIEGILTLSTTNGSTEVNGLSKSYNRLYAHAYDNSSNSFREITYTLTAKEGFVITGYSITYSVNKKGEITVKNATQTQTPNDFEKHTLTYQYANAARSSAYSTRSTQFTLSSTNASNLQYITITDFSVTVLSEGSSTPTPDPDPDPTPTTYAVTTTANPAAGGTAKFAVGTGSQKTQGDVENGTQITLYAVPNTGYNFVNWTLGGNVVSTDATCNVSVAQASSYVANFEAIQQPGEPTYPLAGKYFRLKTTVNSAVKYMNVGTQSDNSHGNVNMVNLNETSDDQIFLFEQSGDGYKLKAKSGNYIKCAEWNVNANTTNANEASVLLFEESGDGYLINWYNTFKGAIKYFNVQTANAGDRALHPYSDGDKNSAAVWFLEEVKYTITATANPATVGTVTVNDIEGGAQVSYNGSATLKATVTDDNYLFANWTNGTDVISENATHTINNVTADSEYVANFKKKTNAINIELSEGGTATINGEQTTNKDVETGSNVTITATPSAGYYFVNWTNGTDVVSTDATYTFTATADTNLKANFEQIVVNATLTDAQGNTYEVLLSDFTNGVTKETVATKLTEKYPYITLGTIENVITLNENNGAYTYTNTVELPFKVSNAAYLWHNIYYPSNNSVGSKPGCPNYIAALNEDEVVDMAASGGYYYGDNPTYNTKDGGNSICWAIYNVNNSFEFIFKSRVTGKYSKVESVVNATGNTQNVKFVENAEDATAFTLLKDAGSYNGDYALVAKVGNATGYLCATSSDMNYVTHFDRNNHQGAWVKFVEAPDYFSMIQDLGIALGYFFGYGDRKCIITGTEIEPIDAALKDNEGSSITLNTLKEYALTIEEAMATWPTIRLSVAPDESGTVTINGEEGVTSKRAPDGHEFPITAVPAEGYHFVKWTKGTDDVSTNAEHAVTISGVKGEITDIIANFEINTYNISVTAGEGGSASASAATVKHGSEVTLTATPSSGYSFAGWYDGENLISAEASYTFTVTSHINYTARFNEVPTGTVAIHITVASTDGTTVTNNATGNVKAIINNIGQEWATNADFVVGADVELVATNDYDQKAYLFDGWYKNGVLVSNDLEITVKATEVATYEARFFRGCVVIGNSNNNRFGYVNSITLADGTSIGYDASNRAVVKAGTTVKINTFINMYAYEVGSWRNANDEIVSTDKDFIVEVNEDVTYTANFEPASYNLTVRANDDNYGTVSATSGTSTGTTVKVGHNMEATITATANTGYYFVNWTKGTDVVSSENPYTIAGIANVEDMADAEYIANFLPVENATAGVYYRIGYDGFAAAAAAGAARAAGTDEVVEYVISTETGSANNGEEKSSRWEFSTSSQYPVSLILEAKSSGNNVDAIDLNTEKGYFDLYCGNNTNNGSVYSTTYTISVSGNYIITGYKMTYTASHANYVNVTNENGYSETPNNKNTVYTMATDGLNVLNTSFTVSSIANIQSINHAIYLSSFVVYIKTASEGEGGEGSGGEGEGSGETPEITANRYYIQSVACGVVDGTNDKSNALKMTQETGAASIFYYDDSKLLSYDKGTYLKENRDGARGLQAVGEVNAGNVTITTTDGISKITAPSYLHANETADKTVRFVDHCTNDGCANHKFVLEEVTTLPVTISSALHATFYAPVAVKIPEGVKAYVLKAEDIPGIETYAWMTSLKNGIIPANTGVIIKGTEGTYYFDIVDNSVENYDAARAEAVGNVLGGTVAKTKITEDAYILANREGKIGLYPVAKNSYLDTNTIATTVRFTNNSHKAYLPVKDDWFGEQLKKGTGFRFVYDDEETTGIDEFETELEDTIYDLQGRKLSEITEPGIYIVGGKKVWIK